MSDPKPLLTPDLLKDSFNIGVELAFEHGDFDVTVTKRRPKKVRQLKKLSQLKGLTVESVSRGAKTYIKTTCGGGLLLEGATVKQELAPDENIALGLLTKEDLASIAKAKRMGIIP